MPEVLLDRDILIDHLRGYDPARQYLKRFETGEVQGYLSVISVGELATGQRRQDLGGLHYDDRLDKKAA